MNSNYADITAIVLTYNEELHIRRCLDNLLQLTDQIFVIDSFSTDKTVEIAEEMGIAVIQHEWPGNQAKQFNWALEHCPINSSWILRLDADEYLYLDTIQEIKSSLPNLPTMVTSLSLVRDRIWMGRRIRFGTGDIVLKRIFRTNTGHSEIRLMDEYIVTMHGEDLLLKGRFADDNINDLTCWTRKHLDYAAREATMLLVNEYNLSSSNNADKCESKKRKQKRMYANLPLFLRAFAYFFLRYYLRLGFLEGKEGFCWHFFQGLWYRMLVDATVFEIKKKCGNDPEKIRDYIATHYHIML